MALVSLGEMVSEQVQKTPAAVAVIYDGEENRCSVQITYSEMWQRASQVHDTLKGQKAEKETVGVCMEPGLNLPSVLLGILRASLSYFPFGVDGIGFVMQTLKRLCVTYLLLDSSSLQGLGSMLIELDGRIIHHENLQSLGIYLVRVNSAGTGQRHLKHIQGLAYCITTSGTTGTPKIVKVPHSCIVSNIVDFRKEFKPSVGDIIFLTSPLTFDPSVIDIFLALTSGAALLLVPPKVKMSGNSLLNTLSVRHRVSLLQITPSLFRRFDLKAVRNTLLGAKSALRVLMFGGESFPDSSLLDSCIHPENHTSVYNLYGITELSCWATLICARLPKGSVKYPVPIGKPLTGTRVKVVDKQGIEVMNGTGHIWIGGSERTCLLNEEDEEVLLDGKVWRDTGDIGKVESDGSIYCLGRDDRQIKKYGKRLNLDTLEKVCKSQAKVHSARAVFSEGQLLLFLEVHEQGNEQIEEMHNNIKAHLRHTLPSQYQPDDVIFVEDFPVNSHGKLDVASLLKNKKRNVEYNYTVVLSVNSWLCSLWKEITGCKNKPLSSTDTFLTCGGDSLMAVQFVHRVEQRIGQEIPDLLDTVLSRTFNDVQSMIDRHTEQSGLQEKTVDSREYNSSEVLIQLQHSANDLQEEKYNVDGMLSSDYDSTESPAAASTVSLVLKSEASVTNKVAEEHVHFRKRGCAGNQDMGEPLLKVSKLISVSKEATAFNSTQECSSLGNTQSICACSDKDNRDSLRTDESPELSAQVIAVSSKEQQRETKLWKEKSACAKGNLYVDSISRANKTSSTADYKMDSDNDNSGSRCRKLCLAKGKETAADRIHLELQWKVNTGKCVDASPLIGRTRCGRGTVFIGSHSHKFFAISLDQGRVNWCVELGDRVEGSACLSPCGKWVIVGCYDHKIYMMKAETGEVDWEVMTGDVVKCSPVSDTSSNLVFCGSHDGFLYSLECKEQRVLWKSWMGGGGVFASPVVCTEHSLVLAATLRGHITALDVMTGTTKWSVSLGKPVFSSPAVYADHLYVGCVDNLLYCLSSKTGEQVWVYKTEAPIFSSPVVLPPTNTTELCILFGSHDSHLYCLSRTGQVVWKHKTISAVYASPFLFRVHYTQRDRQVFHHHGDRKEVTGLINSTDSLKEQNIQNQSVEENLKKMFDEDKKEMFDEDKKETYDEDKKETFVVGKDFNGRCNLQEAESVKIKDFDCEYDNTAVKNVQSQVRRDEKSLSQQNTVSGSLTGQERLCGTKTEVTETSFLHGESRQRDLNSLEEDKQKLENIPNGLSYLLKTQITATKTGSDLKRTNEQYVVCASTQGLVSILCCATGNEIGSVTLPGEAFSSPVVVGDYLVTGCRDDNVYCYNLSPQGCT